MGKKTNFLHTGAHKYKILKEVTKTDSFYIYFRPKKKKTTTVNLLKIDKTNEFGLGVGTSEEVKFVYTAISTLNYAVPSLVWRVSLCLFWYLFHTRYLVPVFSETNEARMFLK